MKDTELARWAQLVSKSTAASMANLSTMIGQEVAVGSFGMRQVPVGKICNFVGGPETLTVGIYLTVSGSANGHIMLMYEPHIALSFVDLLMGQPLGTSTDLDEMSRSALGEMGNVVGSSFLNTIADEANLTLMPSPPTIMTDMAGALIDIIAVDILLTQEEAFVADASFQIADQEVSGTFFVIPGENLIDLISQQLKAA